MEIEEENLQQYEKGKFMKKKIIGMPILLMMILGITLVLAVGGFYYYFTQTVQIHGVINHPAQQNPNIIPLEITGNLHQVLNCTVGTDCSISDITVFNPTNETQTVNVLVSIPASVDSITFGPDFDSSNATNGVMNIAANTGESVFITYHLNSTTVDTAFDSDIVISSNMTQY